jgi:hypothetical protein
VLRMEAGEQRTTRMVFANEACKERKHTLDRRHGRPRAARIHKE